MSKTVMIGDVGVPDIGGRERPANVKPPATLSKSPPVPQPGPPVEEAETLSPTRYGDWEKKGIAIDF